MSTQTKTTDLKSKDPINFEEIPDHIVLPLEIETFPFTVLDEINSRGKLVAERSFKSQDIKPLYKESKQKTHRYAYRDLCICKAYKPPKFCCHHTGNIVIDRDVLSREEHIVHLATPKALVTAPQPPPRFSVRYEQKRYIVLNCTSRITRLAVPNLLRIQYTLDRYKHILNETRVGFLNQQLEDKPEVEVTDIASALSYVQEEKRLQRVARRAERNSCRKMAQQIAKKQKNQVKKIICVLFEEMRTFLLNDQFAMDEGSTLVTVILEAIKQFTDKDFYMTSNLREYQKILAFNLAVWINKFISNLNIHVAPAPPKAPVQEEPNKLGSFLPVSDYISCSTGEEEWCPEQEDIEYEMEELETEKKGDEETATQD